MRVGIGTNPTFLHVAGLAVAAFGTFSGLAGIPLLRWPAPAPSAGLASYGLSPVGRWIPAFMPDLPFFLLLLSSLAVCAGYASLILSNRDRNSGALIAPVKVASYACMDLGMTCCWAGIWGMASFLRHGLAQDHWAPYVLGNTVAGMGLAAGAVAVCLAAAVPLLDARRRGEPSWLAA